MHYFMGGLPRSVLTDVLRTPIPTTYHQLKAKAIDAVRSRVLIDTLVKSKPTARPPNTNWFQPRNQQQQQSGTNRHSTNQGSTPATPHLATTTDQSQWTWDAVEHHDNGANESMQDRMANHNADHEEPASTVAKKATSPETVDNPNKQGPTSDGPQNQRTKHHQDGSTKEKHKTTSNHNQTTPSRNSTPESSHSPPRTKEGYSRAMEHQPRRPRRRIFKRPYLCSLDKERDR
jgi:hypothetical protein